MTTGTDEPKMSKHLILLGRILLPIIALLALWGMKTVGVMLSSLKMETIENNPEATAQTIFVWTTFVIVIILTYKIGVRFKIWSSIGINERTKGTSTSYSASEYGARSGRSRISLGAVVGILVGLAFLALTVLIVVKILQEIDYGLSNAPERMALRGYVPAERVAAALAAAQPALPEVHIVTAPPLGTDGKTNWSAPLHAIAGFPYMGLSVASAAESQWVRKRVDGVVYSFDQRIPVEGHIFEFCSLTNVPIKVKLRGVSEAEKRMSN